MSQKGRTGRPLPHYRQREADASLREALITAGHDDWMARFLAARIEQPLGVDALLNPRLASLPHPDAIPDMARAVSRIADAICSDEPVIFAVDHDMDGQASAALLWQAFVGHFSVKPERLSVITSHRLREGYGITDEVADRIIAAKPALVISADKGSSDEARIARIAAAGIDVVITDHHAVPVEGPPASALACVNPTRADSGFDPTICGAAVAFFCMARVRSELLARGYAQEIAPLSVLLDYVAVATIADCVSLRPDLGAVNRLLVKHGLRAINAARRPCWAVFTEQMRDAVVDSQTVGFQLAPAVAAAGRLNWADVGFRFLVAQDHAEAAGHWQTLQAENEQRKSIEKTVRGAALEQLRTRSPGAAVVVHLDDGHAGVHGITASRLVEIYGRPAAMFAPRQADGELALLSGSFRGVPGFDVRAALQRVDDQQPGLLQRFGGHPGAAGATVASKDFDAFAAAFVAACEQQLQGRSLRPEVWLDGELSPAEISLVTHDRLAALDPWGRDFPPPLFSGHFQVERIRPVGDGSHLQLGLAIPAGGPSFPGIWFSALENAGDELPLAQNEEAHLVYSLSANHFRGQRNLQLMVRGRIPPETE